MSKKNLINAITYVFALFVVINVYAKKKIHSNYFHFSYLGNKIEFITKKHCVTKGQPYQTPDGSHLYALGDAGTQQAKKKRMIIRSGRHRSKETMECLSKTMLSAHKFIDGYFTFFPIDPRLNFAVQGTVIFYKEAFNDVIVAQGRSGFRNNWWFGGRFCTTFASTIREAVTCTSVTGKKWCFVRGRFKIKGDSQADNNGHDEISVFQAPCTTKFFDHLDLSQIP